MLASEIMLGELMGVDLEGDLDGVDLLGKPKASAKRKAVVKKLGRAFAAISTGGASLVARGITKRAKAKVKKRVDAQVKKAIAGPPSTRAAAPAVRRPVAPPPPPPAPVFTMPSPAAAPVPELEPEPPLDELQDQTLPEETQDEADSLEVVDDGGMEGEGMPPWVLPAGIGLAVIGFLMLTKRKGR